MRIPHDSVPLGPLFTHEAAAVSLRLPSLRAASACALLLLGACSGTDSTAPLTTADATTGTIPSAAVGADGNHIANPALETQASATTPLGWSSAFWGSTPTFTYPATGRTGRGATVTQRVNSSGDARWQHAAVPVTAGGRYTYTGWYRSTAATTLIAAYANAAGTLSYVQLAALASSGNRWVQLSSTFTVPAGIVRVTVYQAISRAGSVTIDDVSLVATDAAPPPPPPPPPPTGSFTEGMVSLTFDDAWESQYVNALPRLEAAGMKGTFYLTTVPVQQRWSPFMTPEAVQDIAAKGHEIAGHTLIHPDLTQITADSVRAEVTASRTYLQTLTGRPVTSLAYPFGRNTSAIQAIVAAAGYTSARGVTFTAQNVASTNRYALFSMCIDPTNTVAVVRAQIDAAMANRTWLILCFHDVKTGGDNLSITPANFQAILDHLRARGTRVVTVAQGRALMGG